MNSPQILVPGLWFYVADKPEAFYIGQVQGQTAMLFRRVIVNDKLMTDSHHTLFINLIGIPITYDICVGAFGFLPSQTEGHEDRVFKTIIPEVSVLRGDNREVVKPATNLYIVIDDSGKRFTIYLSCGENKIYLPEISFVHELQILIFANTHIFPLITINKTKDHETETTI